jgi:AraC-like DNA-binding protein
LRKVTIDHFSTIPYLVFSQSSDLPGMNLNFHWINILILFGALQGLIFFIILLFNKKHPGARFLAALMFVLAYNGFETFNWSSGLNFIYFDIFSFIIIFGVGPSLYLYVTTLLNPERVLSKKIIAAHYGLVIFHLSVRLAILVYHVLWINKIIESDVRPGDIMDIQLWNVEPISVAVFLGYLTASIYAFRKSGKTSSIKAISKEGQQTLLRWIRALLIGTTIFGIAWVATVATPFLFEVDFDSHYYPIEIGLVLLIYWIAMTGYHRTKVIYLKSSKTSSGPVLDPDYERQLARLKHAMEIDKLYLDPELNLARLSEQTGIQPKTISSILNQYHQTSFSDFVNDYRVQEVKRRMLDPSHQHLTISGIALESGFNSQATFQRAFKNITGVSPREYMTTSLKKTA